MDPYLELLILHSFLNQQLKLVDLSLDPLTRSLFNKKSQNKPSSYRHPKYLPPCQKLKNNFPFNKRKILPTQLIIVIIATKMEMNMTLKRIIFLGLMKIE
jgi:hypothetical protein